MEQPEQTGKGFRRKGLNLPPLLHLLPSTPLMVSEKSSQAYTTQGGRGSSAWCCLQCLSNPGVLRSTHSLSAHTPYLRHLRSVQRSGGSRMWNPGPSFGFQGVNPRWTLKINCFPTAKTWNLKNPTWHVPVFLDLYPTWHVLIDILKDLSMFLVGSPQKNDAERIWMPCPDTLAGNTFPQLPQDSTENSAHLLSPLDILQVTCPDPLQKQGHYKAATPKYKAMRSVSREVGWQHPGHTERRNRNFFSLNFSFGAPWLQILQVHKERYVHMENLWFTGLWSVNLTPESQDL